MLMNQVSGKMSRLVHMLERRESNAVKKLC